MMNHRALCIASLLVACNRGESPPGQIQVNSDGVRLQGPNGQTVQANRQGVQLQGAPGTIAVNGAQPSTHGTTTQVQGTAGQAVAVQADPSGATQVNVGGIQVAVPNQPAQPAQPAQPGSHAPVVCSGADEVVLTGVTIHGGAMPAVSASGGCRVTLTDCTLNSETVGVAASGGAAVTLTRCTVTGAAGALAASGSAEIHHTACTLHGTVQSSRGATITGT